MVVTFQHPEVRGIPQTSYQVAAGHEEVHPDVSRLNGTNKKSQHTLQV